MARYCGQYLPVRRRGPRGVPADTGRTRRPCRPGPRWRSGVGRSVGPASDPGVGPVGAGPATGLDDMSLHSLTLGDLLGLADRVLPCLVGVLALGLDAGQLAEVGSGDRRVGGGFEDAGDLLGR